MILRQLRKVVISSTVLILMLSSMLLIVLRPSGITSAQSRELSYDDGEFSRFVMTACPSCSNFVAVLFSLPAGIPSASITAVRFYYQANGETDIHITGTDTTQDLIAPIEYSVSAQGWQSVDISGVSVDGDFYVMLRQRVGSAGADYWADGGHTYVSEHPGAFTAWTRGDAMIRATIVPEIHVGADQKFKTIQAGVDAASPGVPVIVHDGTYVENVKVDKSITIQSQNGAATTIVRAADLDEPVFTVAADQATISGFTVQGDSELGGVGTYLDSADGCNISQNNFSNLDIGIDVAGSSSGDSIDGNEFSGNVSAIQIEGTRNQVTGNYIHDNTGSTGSAIALAASASANVIHFNKILKNSEDSQSSQSIYNENSAEMVNAILNWWDSATGPHNANSNPTGKGDTVGGGVSFKPWLQVAPVAVESKTMDGTPSDTLDARVETSTEVIKTGGGSPTVWVASFSEDPGGVFPTSAVGKWVDVYFDSTSSVEQVEVRLFYSASDVANLDESLLRLHWWDGSKWAVCSDSGVNKTEDYIWARLDAKSTPGLNDLAGTLFAGGTVKAGFAWWWIVFVLLGVLVLIVLIVIGRSIMGRRSKTYRPAAERYYRYQRQRRY